MSTKEHYDNHLGNFYSWMIGDFETKQNEFQDFLKDNGVIPSSSKNAIDLGAGHGLQSVPLAKIGFNVTAIDFNQQLLDELKVNAIRLNIEILNEDIREIKHLKNKEPELIICCGDTISHLDNKKEIEMFIAGIASILKVGGKILLSFRDYTTELTGDSRFIPVKSDETKILTCILDYDKETVRVTDLLNEKTETGWNQKVSSYNKVRISTNEIVKQLEANGLKIQLNKVINRMTNIIATKP
jgi:2-polyprenyl-3-methyl-5-hydroxy-6-metoxy-1,4-benzoquinol methylase